MDSLPIQEQSPCQAAPAPQPRREWGWGWQQGLGPGWRGPGALCLSGCWSQLSWFSEATLTPSTCSARGSDYRLSARR